MVSVTISISEELKKKMEQFPEINWSGLVRTIIENKVKNMAWKKEMLKNLENEKDFNDWAVDLVRKGRHIKK